ncbi:TRAP transporter small permease subunit [Piscinibacter sakaiensis]|uniref:TRAP transporter small permease protein n=1 Tax=Piscinibacter sakaiensis TaxID=1547922 RepID=A0A0K8P298_PISS1|nr:TRAP transporter small permease subunit [Piscinibacter sakaiensis]GAP36743.1 TRAP-type transport system, small permease component, putative N-acetylneuraminate transporter [Piscinibacter sakaiensis]
MDALLLACDRLSTLVGRLFGWFIVALVALIAFEVVARYAFGTPHAWAPDVAVMAFAALFMMGGAYTLAQQNHVRGDILYGMLAPRTQAGIDLLLYLVFFCPGVVALAWAGWGFAAESWAIGERSGSGSGGPLLYPLKALIPLAGLLLLLQGLAEMLRCVACLRSGQWPARRGDVQEVDVDELRARLGTAGPAAPEAAR